MLLQKKTKTSTCLLFLTTSLMFIVFQNPFQLFIDLILNYFPSKNSSAQWV